MSKANKKNTNESGGSLPARWALILGSSKGLGLATAKKLARAGYGILAVHRDRKTDMASIDNAFEEIRSAGTGFQSFNADAVLPSSRKEIIAAIKKQVSPNGKITVLVHSIAKGHLKPMAAGAGASLEGVDLQLTINAMAISLYDWIKELYENNLFAADTRVIAFTSEGSTRALPYYGAVSAAKSALEAIVRSIALEFAKEGIKANCIQAGVTNTESFQRIPNSDRIRELAIKRNPNGRLTEPEDVANAVYLLCRKEAGWITGTIIKVDGGESLM